MRLCGSSGRNGFQLAEMVSSVNGFQRIRAVGNAVGKTCGIPNRIYFQARISRLVFVQQSVVLNHL